MHLQILSLGYLRNNKEVGAAAAEWMRRRKYVVRESFGDLLPGPDHTESGRLWKGFCTDQDWRRTLQSFEQRRDMIWKPVLLILLVAVLSKGAVRWGWKKGDQIGEMCGDHGWSQILLVAFLYYITISMATPNCTIVATMTTADLHIC